MQRSFALHYVALAIKSFLSLAGNESEKKICNCPVSPFYSDWNHLNKHIIWHFLKQELPWRTWTQHVIGSAQTFRLYCRWAACHCCCFSEPASIWEFTAILIHSAPELCYSFISLGVKYCNCSNSFSSLKWKLARGSNSTTHIMRNCIALSKQRTFD